MGLHREDQIDARRQLGRLPGKSTQPPASSSRVGELDDPRRRRMRGGRTQTAPRAGPAIRQPYPLRSARSANTMALPNAFSERSWQRRRRSVTASRRSLHRSLGWPDADTPRRRRWRPPDPTGPAPVPAGPPATDPLWVTYDIPQARALLAGEDVAHATSRRPATSPTRCATTVGPAAVPEHDIDGSSAPGPPRRSRSCSGRVGSACLPLRRDGYAGRPPSLSGRILERVLA